MNARSMCGRSATNSGRAAITGLIPKLPGIISKIQGGNFRRVRTRLRAPAEILATVDQVENPSTPVYPTTLAYDRETAAMVHGHYEPDFEAFDYDRESWMQLESRPSRRSSVGRAAASQ